MMPGRYPSTRPAINVNVTTRMAVAVSIVLGLPLAGYYGCSKNSPPPAPVDLCDCAATGCDCGDDCRCAVTGKPCKSDCDCGPVPEVHAPVVPVVPPPLTAHYVCPRCQRTVDYTWPDGVAKPIDCGRCSRPGAYQRMRRVDANKGAAMRRPARSMTC